MSRQNKKEVLIIMAMLLLSLPAILLIRMNKGGSRIVVNVAGEVYGEYELNVDREIEIISETGVNVLKIENGKARMISASCPDKICMNMTALSEDYIGVIVCLPHEVIVEIK